MNTPQRPMKDSGVEWLGDIPAHWQVAPLWSIASRVKDRGTDDLGIVTAFRDGQVTLRSNRRVDGFTEATDFSGYQRIRPGQLAIHSMDAGYGCMGVSDSEGMCSPVLVVCDPIGAVDFNFIAHALREMSRRGWILALTRSIRERTSEFRWSDASVQKLPFPPVQEQRAIATFLDRETAQIDDLVAKQERLIELLGERRQAVISRAVTRGLHEGVPLKDSGVEWLGDIPAHWLVTRVARVSNVIGGGTPDKDESNWVPEVPWATPVDLAKVHGGKLVDTERKISFEAAIRGSKTVEPGSLLVSCRAPIGYVAETTGRVAFNQGVKGIQVGPRVQGQYLKHWIHANTEILKSKGYGTTFQEISMSALNATELPLPPLEEQRAIATFLDRETAQIDALVQKSRAMIDLLKERRQALISAAVTGKLAITAEGRAA